MPPRTIYVETSVIGYAATRSVADPLTNSRLDFTRQWLDKARSSPDWRLFVSDVVLREASAGDPAAARERMELLDRFTELETPRSAPELAERLLTSRTVPRNAADDALHIAIAAVNGVEFLVTWNFTHIANATLRRSIERICKDAGYDPPIICTPEQLKIDEPA